VLVGGMCVLNINFEQTRHDIFTKKPESLTNDFFVNLLDRGIEWKAISYARDLFEGRDRKTEKSNGPERASTSSSVRTSSSGLYPRLLSSPGCDPFR